MDKTSSLIIIIIINNLLGNVGFLDIFPVTRIMTHLFKALILQDAVLAGFLPIVDTFFKSL